MSSCNNVAWARIVFPFPCWVVLKRGHKQRAYPTFLLILSIVLLIGCSGPDESDVNSDSTSAKTNAAQKQEKRLDGADIPDEIYDDADTFSTPRIQFVVRIKESGLQEIWSSRLDGTDVRRVVPADLLNSPELGSINRPPVRSPDNRYIIYSLATKNGIKKQLLDLKEKKLEVIAEGGGIPSFQWTPDSKNIIFALVGGKYNDRVQYNLDTKTISKKKHMKNSGGVYLIPHNMHFITMTYEGFAEYDFEGSLIREVKLAERIQKYPFYSVSRDGSLLMYRSGGINRIINPDKPGELLATIRGRPGLFHPNGSDVLYLDGGNLVRINIATLDTKPLLNLTSRIFHMSIYND